MSLFQKNNAKPTYNPNLPFTISNWQGNPLHNGLYTNLHGDKLHQIKDVYRWMAGPKPLAPLKKNQQSPLSYQPIFNLESITADCIIPLGHAGFIISLSGTRLLIDPVLTSNPFLKRFTPIPISPSALLGIDYLLLSHNHRDHIDKTTVQKICAANPNCKILTGLETGKQLRKWNIKNKIEEAGWFQTYKTNSKVKIDYLPAQHWSRRWLKDTNINLWGSFMITQTDTQKTIYFGADSGYAPHFAQIGALYNIDLAMLGIGAFEPQWFMSAAHTGPQAALQAFTDLKAKTLMPMHYGTFDLSDEPVFYAEQQLVELNKIKQVHIRLMEIGTAMGLTAKSGLNDTSNN